MSLDAKSTRREALRTVIFIAGSASVGLLGASGLLIFLSRNSSTQQVSKATATLDGSTFLSINVAYVGMTSTIGTSEENLQIPAPATLSDLVSYVCKIHPVIQTMPSMQVLLNGSAPGGDPMLSNGDEVAFVSAIVGG